MEQQPRSGFFSHLTFSHLLFSTAPVKSLPAIPLDNK